MARHSNKEIEAALKYAEANGWRVFQSSGGHNWGYMLCAHDERDGCRKPIYSTPRNAENHAKRLLHAINNCPHT